MKPVIITPAQWKELKTKFNSDYPPSVNLVREKMKRTIGCTPRFHETWNDGRYAMMVHLDFFDEHKKTMFVLKYSSYIERQNENSYA